MWAAKIGCGALVALVILAQYCFALDLFMNTGDYLKLPHSRRFQLDDIHAAVRQALTALEIDDSFNANSIVHRLETLISKGHWHSNMYQFLLRLERLPPLNPDVVLRLVKSIAAQTGPNCEQGDFVESGRSLLENYIRPKIGLWKTYYEKEYIDESKYPLLNEFDAFFGAGLNVDMESRAKPVWQAELAHLLESVDLTQQKFKVHKMVVASTRIKSDRSKKSVRPLDEFMYFRCRDLQRDRHVLELLNLRTIFPDWPELKPHRNSRLNQYYRLCLAWFNRETQAKIIENMEKQLAGSWCNFSACLGKN